MARTTFLGPLSLLAVAGIVPLAIACNGRVSLGSTGNTLQSLSPSTAATNVEPTSPVTCATNWAHPNICCESSSSSETQCGTWEDNPFEKCADGFTTYPNQTECCDLANPAACVSASAGSTGVSATSGSSSGSPSGSSSGTSNPATGTTPVSPPAYGCGFACPPGWWSQAIAGEANGPTAPGCCTLGTGGALTCAAQGEGDTSISTPACGGPDPVLIEDAGASDDAGDDASATYPDDAGTDCYEDAGSSSWPGYDGGAASLCAACPSGWSATDALQPELCCQALPNGIVLCFSQATGWASGGGGSSSGIIGSSGSSSGSEPDASITSPSDPSWASSGAGLPDGAPGPSCSGSSVSCSCEETTSGHTYALDCYSNSNGLVTCSCSVDGNATGAAPTVDSCEDENAVTNAFGSTGCAFP